MTLAILWFMLYKQPMYRETSGNRFEALETAIARHAVPVLVVALILAAGAGWVASHLTVWTSRKAMFPKDTPALVRMERFMHDFGTGSTLVVVAGGAPLPVLKTFVTRFAARLRRQPEIAEAVERLDLDFFERHAYLMAPHALLNQLRAWTLKYKRVLKIPGTITMEQALDRVEKWLANPPDMPVQNLDIQAVHQGIIRVNLLLNQWLHWVNANRTPQRIPWARLTNHPELERFLAHDGYFLTHDHKMAIILVNPSNTSEEINVLSGFINTVRAVGNTLRAKFAREGKPVPFFGITGLPAVDYEAHRAVRSDILMIVLTAGVLVLLLVLFGMRSWRRSLIVFVPMGLGAVWNAALTLVTVGHLTEITSGFTAILFGMGVDYGIFMSSRIAEEHAKGLDFPVAIGRGAAASARAILTAGGATTLIFASLYFVKFKGFSEMGMVAATGIVLVIIATFTVLPAMYTILHPGVQKSTEKAESGIHDRRSGLSWSPGRATALVIVVLAIGFAVWGAYKGSGIPFDYNALSLLPRGSETAKYQRILVKNSDFQPGVVIFTATNMDQARRFTREAKNCPLLANVESIVDLFPRDMEARVALVRKIGHRVAESGVAGVLEKQPDVRLNIRDARRIGHIIKQAQDLIDDMEDQAFSSGKKAMVADLEKSRGILKQLASAAYNHPKRFAARTTVLFNRMLAASRKVAGILAGWQDARPLTPKDLPRSLRNRFFARHGHRIAIYAYPRKSVYNMHNLEALLKDVYAIDPQATGFPTTNLVFSRMANNSLRQGALWALVIVLFWILVNARRLRGFVEALVPLLVGESWLLGVMSLAGMKFNYGNIITIPLVMAIAVDYGVWFANRRYEMPDSSPWVVTVTAARAILLAAGTTIAGLGAIMLASYRGIASMGTCLTIGVIACIIAALLVAPALDQLMGRPG